MAAALTVTHQDDQQTRLEGKLRRELGEAILRLLGEEDVEDILLNPDSSLWVKRRGAGFVPAGDMKPVTAASALGTVAALRGTVLNHDHPILETELPLDGSRFEGVVAPVVRQPVFAIRLRPRKVFTLDEYEAAGILTSKEDASNRVRQQQDFALTVRGLPHAEIIRAAVRERKNILVVGATGSGKTTLLNAILDAITELTPFDRVISIEDTTELQCRVPNYLDLRAVGNVTMLECLRASMRLKPTRIVVGEVRGAEAHTLLKAWNTGHPGGLGTVHANGALLGLTRLESLVAEGTDAPQQRLIAETVDLVIFVDPEPSLAAGRKVREMLLFTGWKEDITKSNRFETSTLMTFLRHKLSGSV